MFCFFFLFNLKLSYNTDFYVIDITYLFTLVLTALPSPPIDVKVSDVTSTSVKLSWSHPNPDDIQYYTISHKPRSASQSPGVISGVVTMYYTIRPLSPYTQYEFTISAVNGFGHGPPSPPIVATTGETGNAFVAMSRAHNCLHIIIVSSMLFT